MTVCIAAECRDRDDNRAIVVCAHKRAGNVLGSSETLLKLRPISHEWNILMAGTVSEMTTLWRLYKNAFVNAELTQENIDASVKEPLFRRKRELAEEYVQTTFGFSYEELIKSGKERLPADIFHAAIERVRSIDLGCEFVVFGYLGKHAEIYHCSSAGKATAAMDYAVIGEDEYLAGASLQRRGQHGSISLDETLYNVYEAKRLAEAVGSVGKLTTLAVCYPGQDIEHMQFVSVATQDQLDALFDKYGPKPLPRDVRLEGKLFLERKRKQPKQMGDSDTT